MLMNNRVDMINRFYNKINEDVRLTNSRHGQLEYLTTMEYIHKNANPAAKIIEIGAGTGRYSIGLAKEGYHVTSVELVEQNLKILRENAKGIENLESFQGDALNLSRFADNTFDVTLVLGPLYHIYDRQEVDQAINEAIRVTKQGGIIIAAFLSVHAILYTNYFGENFKEGIKENFNDDFSTRHFTEQLFTGYDVKEFEDLFAEKKTEYITTVSADSILEFIDIRTDLTFTDEEFELLLKYHLAVCEKRELLGFANHLLYICRKK